jgi:peptidoglycan/xylan/chitin deacetylase (PgdA/CDA1 family)|tara:strand:- start:7679 stop:8503 length:825 start_codon:yes stop_codon:yes gene_type:complete
MAQHHICLTFDFDSVSLWMALGQTSPTPISRGEFGVVAAGRILRLLAKHEIKSTWFIPGVTLQTYPDICQEICEHGHEIAHHGFTHVSPANMSRSEELETLKRGNEAIKKISGNYARGYRSPAWDLSESSVDLLLDQGFIYDSSMMAHDHLPYFARHGDVLDAESIHFGEPSSLIEMPISWSLDDFPHFEYFRGTGLMNANQVLDNWLGDFTFMQSETEWGVLTYTFHPFVIGRGHRMLILEQLIEQLKSAGALFKSVEEAADLFIARDEMGSE